MRIKQINSTDDHKLFLVLHPEANYRIIIGLTEGLKHVCQLADEIWN